MTRARDITVAVTAMGSLEGRDPVLRSGARPGDLVAIHGRLGWAAAGLVVLGRGFRSPRVLVEAHRVPQVSYGAGAVAARAGATSMIDISDGLLADLGPCGTRPQTCVIDLRQDAFEVAEPLRGGRSGYRRGSVHLPLHGRRRSRPWRLPFPLGRSAGRAGSSSAGRSRADHDHSRCPGG